MKFLALAAALIGVSTAASAATLTVDAKANGLFGQLLSGGQDMIQGETLSLGDTVMITATGTIDIGAGLTVGPNGVDLDSSSGKVSASEYTPLEEAAVDANAALANNTLMPNLGALMAAFMPVGSIDGALNKARDTDNIFGAINASDLFFVGESLTFTAGFDGTLFFGINEGFVTNNTGAFTVTTTAVPPTNVVPLPASGLMLIAGLGAFGLARRRKTA